MANVLHTIKAYLYDNQLTDNPNDLSARVSSERSLSIDDICKSAVTRGGADVSAASMKHAVELFLKEMGYRLCDGFSVNTGYFTASPSIRGVFDSPNEKFNSEKHSVLFQFNQGEMLRKELSAVTVEILGVAESGAFIAQVTDVKSGTVNDLLTPDRNLKITGSKIKIAGETPNETGVSFINQATQDIIKVPESDIVTNNPSEVIIIIPELIAGEYKLQIVTQYSSGKNLKEARTLLFDKILTVS